MVSIVILGRYIRFGYMHTEKRTKRGGIYDIVLEKEKNSDKGPDCLSRTLALIGCGSRVSFRQPIGANVRERQPRPLMRLLYHTWCRSLLLPNLYFLLSILISLWLYATNHERYPLSRL